MQGPLSAFEDWFALQPPDVCNDIAGMALIHIGGMRTELKVESLLGEDLVPSVLAELERLNEGAAAYETVALVVSLRALMDFFVFRVRGTAQAWDETLRFNEQMRDSIRAQGDDAEFVQEMIDQFPLRRRQWLRAAEQWQELVTSAWSDANLAGWLDAQMVASHRDKR